MKKMPLAFTILVLALFLSGPAAADLSTLYAVNGNVGISIDGLGSNSSPTGNIDASIPIGATILKAYLYSALANQTQDLSYFNSGQISLAGNLITNYSAIVGIPGYSTARAEVTSLITSLNTGGPIYSWEMTEGTINYSVDGHALVIVYTAPSLPSGSVAILDGGQAQAGDTTTVNFASPLVNVSDPNFFLDMSLGISYSANGPTVTQYSNVDINGQRLTSSAGSNDDGIPQYVLANGALITVGGIGDSINNPDPNTQDRAADDELYSLKPFLQDGDTGFTMFTNNPSFDDNIFLLTLHSGVALKDINDQPIVPIPGAVWLLGSGLVGLAGWRRLKKG